MVLRIATFAFDRLWFLPGHFHVTDKHGKTMRSGHQKNMALWPATCFWLCLLPVPSWETHQSSVHIFSFLDCSVTLVLAIHRGALFYFSSFLLPLLCLNMFELWCHTWLFFFWIMFCTRPSDSNLTKFTPYSIKSHWQTLISHSRLLRVLLYGVIELGDNNWTRLFD